MYAIVDVAGQQFKVEKGQKIFVHRLDMQDGENLDIDQVLLIENEGKILLGQPLIKGARVTAKIIDHPRGDKVIVFKKKRRKGYRVRNGHRQDLTQLLIENIEEKAAPKKAAAKAETSKPAAPKATTKKAEKATPAAKDVTVKGEAKKATASKPAAKVPAAKKTTAAKKPAATATDKKTSAKTGATAKKPATKTTAATKKPAAKASAATKKSTAKKPVARKAPVKSTTKKNDK